MTALFEHDLSTNLIELGRIVGRREAREDIARLMSIISSDFQIDHRSQPLTQAVLDALAKDMTAAEAADIVRDASVRDALAALGWTERRA